MMSWYFVRHASYLFMSIEVYLTQYGIVTTNNVILI